MEGDPRYYKRLGEHHHTADQEHAIFQAAAACWPSGCLAESIWEISRSYPADLLLDAIRQAYKARGENVGSLNYVRKIADGFVVNGRPKDAPPRTPFEPKPAPAPPQYEIHRISPERRAAWEANRDRRLARAAAAGPIEVCRVPAEAAS